MSSHDAERILVQEAKRLTEQILQQDASPTRRAAVYNRCLESLERIQERVWAATDKKWQDTHQLDPETAGEIDAQKLRTCPWCHGEGCVECSS